jgi:hypothetical protein
LRGENKNAGKEGRPFKTNLFSLEETCSFGEIKGVFSLSEEFPEKPVREKFSGKRSILYPERPGKPHAYYRLYRHGEIKILGTPDPAGHQRSEGGVVSH